MRVSEMKILAIESSCDETAAAVVEDGSRVISSVIASQVKEHILKLPRAATSNIFRRWRSRP